MIPDDENETFLAFRDCLSLLVIEKLTPTIVKPTKRRTSKGRKGEVENVASKTDNADDAAELSEFVDYLAEETFSNLPEELRTISFAVTQDNPDAAGKYAVPLETAVVEEILKTVPLTITESLYSYGLVEETENLDRFVEHVLNDYVSAATAAPSEYTPAIAASRPSGCEICGREHLQLTYHHLIPRQTHAKAVKRGWHNEWALNKVAWLCRACHSYVHKIATNEELARDLYDVDLLMQREDVQRWAAWVTRVRWKAR